MVFVFMRTRRHVCFVILGFVLISVFLASCAKGDGSPGPEISDETISTTERGPIEETKPNATELSTQESGMSSDEPSTALPTVVPHPGFNLATFTSDNFVGSGNCAVCHSELSDEAGNDVSNDSHWRSAMMANSAKDPFWQAKVSSEVARNSTLKAVIEDKCANCHTPMVHEETSAKGESVVLLTDGILHPDNPHNVPAMDGVSCTLCHQIQDLDLGENESFSGGYVIDTEAVSPDRPIFGPFEDQFEQLMIGTV